MHIIIIHNHLPFLHKLVLVCFHKTNNEKSSSLETKCHFTYVFLPVKNQQYFPFIFIWKNKTKKHCWNFTYLSPAVKVISLFDLPQDGSYQQERQEAAEIEKISNIEIAFVNSFNLEW